jgi:hypothetical protein
LRALWIYVAAPIIVVCGEQPEAGGLAPPHADTEDQAARAARGSSSFPVGRRDSRDRHYGHLARDGREHAIRLVDSYADVNAPDVQDSDVGWTPQLPIVAGRDNGNGA